MGFVILKKKICSIVLAVVFSICFLSGCILDEWQERSVSPLPEAASPTVSQTEAPVSGEMVVSFIDVGQGDASFICLPDGKTMLIDAGVSDAGKKLVKLLEASNCQKIDYLIATHPHADHIGGMKKIVESFEIGEIYMPRASTNTKTYEKLLESIAERGLKIKAARAGMQICPGVEILAPNGAEYENLNNYSVVIKITNGNTKFLFMGDAEILSEDEILQGGYDVSADVIKVGHHGSGTSSGNTFVAAVGAKYAVFSVGTDNSYNHPHRFVVEKWKNAGAEICRTDERGTVTFRSDGKTLQMTTEK